MHKLCWYFNGFWKTPFPLKHGIWQQTPKIALTIPVSRNREEIHSDPTPEKLRAFAMRPVPFPVWNLGTRRMWCPQGGPKGLPKFTHMKVRPKLTIVHSLSSGLYRMYVLAVGVQSSFPCQLSVTELNQFLSGMPCFPAIFQRELKLLRCFNGRILAHMIFSR